MAIESVSAATITPQPLRADQSAATQAEQSRQASSTREAAQPSQGSETPESQQPQPVVNAQGQVTGKIVNTVA